MLVPQQRFFLFGMWPAQHTFLLYLNSSVSVKQALLCFNCHRLTRDKHTPAAIFPSCHPEDSQRITKNLIKQSERFRTPLDRGNKKKAQTKRNQLVPIYRAATNNPNNPSFDTSPRVSENLNMVCGP